MATAKRPAQTSVPIHPNISHRWSPRAYESKPVEQKNCERCSKRRVGQRHPTTINRGSSSSRQARADKHKLALEGLMEFNQSWAKHAPILGFSVARKKFAGKGQPNAHAWHDVGQAMATLSMQAKRWDCKSTRWPASCRTRSGKISRFLTTTSQSRLSSSGTRAQPIPFPNP